MQAELSQGEKLQEELLEFNILKKNLLNDNRLFKTTLIKITHEVKHSNLKLFCLYKLKLVNSVSNLSKVQTFGI